MRTEFCFPPIFVKSYQTSNAPSSCLGAGQIFVKGENCQILQFAGVNLNENVNQVNLILLSKDLFRQKPAKIFLRSNRTVRTENGENKDHYSYLEMLNATPYNFYGSEIFVPVAPSSTSNNGSILYSNCPSTSTAADQSEIANGT